MEFLVTLGLIGLCMGFMAIGVLFRRKPLTKDCGLDPHTGERITDCVCANQGKPQCLKRKVLNLFASEPPAPIPQPETEKVIPLSRRDS